MRFQRLEGFLGAWREHFWGEASRINKAELEGWGTLTRFSLELDVSTHSTVYILPFWMLTGHLVNMLKDVSQPHTVLPLCSIIAYWDTKLSRTTNKNTFISRLDGYNAGFVYLDLFSDHQALQEVCKEGLVKSWKQNLFSFSKSS